VVIGLVLASLPLAPGPGQSQEASQEAFSVYEDWSGSRIRGDRWRGGEVSNGQEVRRELKSALFGNYLTMSLRREGETDSDTGSPVDPSLASDLITSDTTPKFAGLPGAITPDYILPVENFFPTGGGSLNYASGADIWNYGTVPTNGELFVVDQVVTVVVIAVRIRRIGAVGIADSGDTGGLADLLARHRHRRRRLPTPFAEIEPVVAARGRG
jgi:hypothetical protein